MSFSEFVQIDNDHFGVKYQPQQLVKMHTIRCQDCGELIKIPFFLVFAKSGKPIYSGRVWHGKIESEVPLLFTTTWMTYAECPSEVLKVI